MDTAKLMKERDALEARVAELEAVATSKVGRQIAEEEFDGDWKPLGLVRKLLQQQQENEQLQVGIVHNLLLSCLVMGVFLSAC